MTSVVFPSQYALERYRASDPNVRVFYKYQAFRDYTVPTLAKQQIYLSKYEQLNDPFDPFLSALTASDPAAPMGQDDSSESLLRILADAAIFCVSEVPDNLLLWAHYADAYKGYCLGYAAYVVPNPRILHPVRYVDRIPTALRGRSILSSQELLEGCLLTKPKDWSYEREWRFIMSGDVGLLDTPFPVVKVIFGPRMSNEQRSALSEATRATNPTFQVASAVLRNYRFRVSIDPASLP